jgi:glyoxylase-like metal-dependent hydrolase (beta-lactamase superfamily II)
MRSIVPLLLLAVPAVAHAQAARPTVADSYLRARRALDSAVARHGGPGAMRAAGRIRLTVEGEDHWRNQSLRATTPYDRTPYTATLWLDNGAGRFVWQSTSHFVGGFHNENRTVIDSARGFNANLRQGLYFPAPNRTIGAQRGVLDRLPHVALATALEFAGTVRWLGPHRLTSGAAVDVVVASTPNGAITIALDPRTREVRALLGVRPDALAGDAPVENEFSAYTRASGGLLVPGRMVTRVAGEVVQDVRYRDVAIGEPVPDSLLAPPAGFAQAPPAPPGDPVRELAPGTWAIRGAGYWALAVLLGDSLAVIEAGQGGAAETLAHLARVAPGKPVRWIVPTHHHDDHSGSVPAWLAAGATLVTTPGNRAYFTRMAAARSTLRPTTVGGAAPPSGAPRIETFARRRVLSGGGRTIELHDIGPSPHAAEMLVAWMPAEGILFQGDQLNLPPTGVVPRGLALETMTHFRDWVRRQGWNVTTLTGTHMAPGTMAQLDEAIAKATP